MSIAETRANEAKTNVLIIDDDQTFAQLLADYLSSEGFAVQTVHDGTTGLASALSHSANIIILDVMLPGKSGTEVLRELRMQSNLPVLMLTARGDDIDRIVGLELGADDYLPKPANPREVVARLRAILRRASEPPPTAEINRGSLSLNSANRRATIEQQPLDLTSTEFSILELLMRHAGEVVDKNALSQHALKRPLGRYDRSVDMHISHLRRKLQTGGLQDDPIHTIRGAGYQLVVDG